MEKEFSNKKISIEEAEAKHLLKDDRLGPDPVPFGFMNSKWNKLKSQIKDGDELHEFRSDSHSWENMYGREGIALVRDGKIVDSIITKMN